MNVQKLIFDPMRHLQCFHTAIVSSNSILLRGTIKDEKNKYLALTTDIQANYQIMTANFRCEYTSRPFRYYLIIAMHDQLIFPSLWKLYGVVRWPSHTYGQGIWCCVSHSPPLTMMHRANIPNRFIVACKMNNRMARRIEFIIKIQNMG